MGRREGDPDPALQSFVTGVYALPAEGGTAFFSPRLLCFSFCPHPCEDKKGYGYNNIRNGSVEELTNHDDNYNCVQNL